MPRTARRNAQRGFSYLELQVSMVLFAIAIGGVGSLAVLHSRQINRVEDRFPANTERRLAPPSSMWERKLGNAAEIVASFPPPIDETRIVDDGGVGYQEIQLGTYDWYHWFWTSNYGGDVRFNYCDDAGDHAIWTFDGIQPGKYRVYVTWEPFWFVTTEAVYQVYDDTNFLNDKKFDQTKVPSGPIMQGVRWQEIGKFDFYSNRARVLLYDNDNQYIEMDAVQLVRVENELEVLSYSESLSPSVATALIDVKFHEK